MIDLKKVIEANGYRPSLEFETGLEEEMARYISDPRVCDRIFKNLYRPRRRKKASKAESLRNQ